MLNVCSGRKGPTGLCARFYYLEVNMEHQLEKNRFLGELGVARLMLKFSIPCVLANLLSSIYNVVDQLFIGNSELSTLGNAATGVVFPLFIIAQAFAWCFGDGCAAHLNVCQGRGNSQNAHKAIGTGVLMTLAVSALILAVFYPFKRELLMLFGASEQSIGMAIEYFDIVLAFFPVYMLYNMLNAVMRSDGSPGIAMLSVVIGAVVNIILDPVFIFGFHWGMAGAAWATAIGQVCSLLVTLYYYCIKGTRTFTLTRKSFVPDFKEFSHTLKPGMPSFLIQITIVILSLTCNMMLARYGALSPYGADIPVAIFGIEAKVYTIVTTLIVGVVIGCQPIVSYNIGAKKFHRVKQLYKLTLLYTLAVGVLATLVFELFPHAVTALFGTPTNIPNPEHYWIFAEKTFRIFLSLVIFNCFQKMTSIFLQFCGRPVHSIVSSTVRDLFCFVPLVIILPMFFGVEGILFAGPIADLVAGILSTVMTIPVLRSLHE